MSSAKKDLTEPVQSAEPKQSPQEKKKRPLWGALALVLIALSTLFILYMANVQIRKEQQNNLFEGTLFPVQVSEGDTALWGYLNKDGELVIPAVYQEATQFAANGLAAVMQDGLWGFIDKSGELVIPCRFETTRGFGEERLAPVKLDGLWGYIDKRGKLVIPCTYTQAEAFGENGLAAIRVDEKYGYIDENGRQVIEPIYTAAGSFDENNRAIVKAFGQWGMINKRGEFVINPQFDSLGEFSPVGLALVQKDGLFGYIDRDGKYVIPPTFPHANAFAANGLAAVCTELYGLYGYINTAGKMVIPPAFDQAMPFALNGLAAVAVNDPLPGATTAFRWGYIDEDGELVIDMTFTYASDFVAGLAAVRDEDGFHYINDKGERMFSLGENCTGAHAFCDDGYAITVHFDGPPEYNGGLTPVNRYIEIIDKTGKVIHTQRLLALGPVQPSSSFLLG